MPASHTPFAILNRTANPILGALLRSPLHPLISRQLALITVIGRKSGREYTFPTAYHQTGEDRVTITVGWPERKRWWRNLRDEGAPVRLWLKGTECNGHAVAKGDETSGVTVEITLGPAS